MKRAAGMAAAGLALMLAMMVGFASAQESSEAATDSSMEAPPPMEGAAADAGAAVEPRDPSVGAVTHLPIPRYVSLKTGEGNARRGPGLTHRIDWVFKRAGMPLRITAEYEHWRRVEDADGAGGWIHYSLLSGVRTVLVTQDMAEFFSQPDTTSQVVYQAETDVIGKLLECNPDWCRISVEGEKGWAPKTALWGVDPDEIVE